MQLLARASGIRPKPHTNLDFLCHSPATDTADHITPCTNHHKYMLSKPNVKMESLPTADDTDPVTTLRHLVRDPAAAQDVYRWLVGSGWFDKSQHGRTFHAHQALDRQQAALNAARAELHRLGDSSDLVNRHSDNNHITTYDTVQSQEYAQQQPHFSQVPHSPCASTEILSEIEVAQRENIAPRRYATRDLFDNYGQDRDYSQRSANSHRSCDSRVAGPSHDPRSHASSHRDEARSHKRDAHRTSHGRNSRSRTQQKSSHRDDHRTSKSDRYRRESQSSADDHYGTARRRESQQHRRHSSRSKSPTPRRHSYHSLRDTPRRSSHRERSEYPDESRRRQSQSSRISRRETSFTFDPAPPAPSEPVLSVQEFAIQDESAYEAHSLEAHGDAVQNTTAQRPFVSNQPQDRSPEKERNNLITPKAFNAGQPGGKHFYFYSGPEPPCYRRRYSATRYLAYSASLITCAVLLILSTIWTALAFLPQSNTLLYISFTALSSALLLTLTDLCHVF